MSKEWMDLHMYHKLCYYSFDMIPLSIYLYLYNFWYQLQIAINNFINYIVALTSSISEVINIILITIINIGIENELMNKWLNVSSNNKH